MEANIYLLTLIFAVVVLVMLNSELCCRELGNYLTGRAKGLRVGRQEYLRLTNKLTPKQAKPNPRGKQTQAVGFTPYPFTNPATEEQP